MNLNQGIVRENATLNTERENYRVLEQDIVELERKCHALKAESDQLNESLAGNKKASEEAMQAKTHELENALLEMETTRIRIADVESQAVAAQTAASQWEEYCNSTLAEQDAYYQAELVNARSQTVGPDGADNVDLVALKVWLPNSRHLWSKNKEKMDLY